MPRPSSFDTDPFSTMARLMLFNSKAGEEDEKDCCDVLNLGLLPNLQLNEALVVRKAKNHHISSNSDPFPWKLHDMLENAEALGFHDIVSWEHGGEAFKVHDPDRFVATVLRCYCSQTRFKSFQRQLNIYGFTRISRGADKGVCFHKFFKRGQKQLCVYMERHKLKEDTILQPESIIMSEEEVEQAASALIEACIPSSFAITTAETCILSKDVLVPVKISEDVVVNSGKDDFASMFEGKLFFPIGEGINMAFQVSDCAPCGKKLQRVLVSP
jgi:hypothetical protein